MKIIINANIEMAYPAEYPAFVRLKLPKHLKMSTPFHEKEKPTPKVHTKTLQSTKRQ
jgi:hypothetical protein